MAYARLAGKIGLELFKSGQTLTALPLDVPFGQPRSRSRRDQPGSKAMGGQPGWIDAGERRPTPDRHRDRLTAHGVADTPMAIDAAEHPPAADLGCL